MNQHLPPPSENETSLADDLLYGADEIAEFIWKDRKLRTRVYRMQAKDNGFPVFKPNVHSGPICARRSKILEWIELQESKRKK